MDDVIAGHKADGLFLPEAWLIAERRGKPAGCILVNDSRVGLEAEVAYMGVVPACRGIGVGAAMLRRSAGLAARRRRGCMTLSVDSDNHYALSRYRSEGFAEERFRSAYIITAKQGPDCES